MKRLTGSFARLALVLAVALSAGCGGDSTGPGDVTCTDPGSICTVVGTGVPAYRGEGEPYAFTPPSTVIDSPLMNAAAGEARNATALAMSSGLP